jgi:hypothetical protein
MDFIPSKKKIKKQFYWLDDYRPSQSFEIYNTNSAIGQIAEFRSFNVNWQLESRESEYTYKVLSSNHYEIKNFMLSSSHHSRAIYMYNSGWDNTNSQVIER